VAYRSFLTSRKLGIAASSVALVVTIALTAGCGTTPGGTRLSERPEMPKPAHQNQFLGASGCGDCHPKQYQEWRTSMHSYAQHSPAVIHFIDFVLKQSGGTIGSFCMRCHTPIGISEGESPLLPNTKRSAEALDSVSCTVCHAAYTWDGQASGVFHVPIKGDPDPTMHGPFYGPDERAPEGAARVIARVPHQARHSSHLTESRFCGRCHDVFFPDGTRLEEAFIEWKNSPYARQGIHCQDCHMSPVPGKYVPREQWPLEAIVDDSVFPEAPKRRRSSHKFTGPDYSLIPKFGQADLQLEDDDFKALETQLEEDRKTLLRNAATMRVEHPTQVPPGERLRVRVDVTNSGAGHNLPTGFASERQVWLEVHVRDGAGKTVYISGDVDRFGDLRDENSEDVQQGRLAKDRDLFNAQARFVIKDFRGTEVEAISPTNRLLDNVPYEVPSPWPSSILGVAQGSRVFKNGIPPHGTKGATYRVRIPAGATGPLALSVRLRYRNFPPHLLKEIGIPEYRSKLRIVDMQTYETTIAVAR
jgi:cytochrome c554/c'-like protein